MSNLLPPKEKHLNLTQLSLLAEGVEVIRYFEGGVAPDNVDIIVKADGWFIFKANGGSVSLSSDDTYTLTDRGMTKDEWIQKAKALLFDCRFDLGSDNLDQECRDLINKGGGYDYENESSETTLKWGGE